MPRKPLPKIAITPERRAHHKKMKEFLKSCPEISFSELRPLGLAIDISTIPKDKEDEFLTIAYSIKI